MSNTLRWSLALVATGLIGLALLLAGVALGRATGGVTGYEPADITPKTYGPVDTGSRPSATFAPVLGAGAGESLDAGMMKPGMTLAPARSQRPPVGSAGVGSNSRGGMMGPGMMGR